MDDKAVCSYYPCPKVKRTMCIFEHIYAARPDSKIYGNNVYAARKALGRQLAKESHVPADIVIAVPDSGMPADRKSTRLNSSHVRISYAVFCLKKKIELALDDKASIAVGYRQ